MYKLRQFLEHIGLIRIMLLITGVLSIWTSIMCSALRVSYVLVQSDTLPRYIS
jgi:hypothetical protein